LSFIRSSWFLLHIPILGLSFGVVWVAFWPSIFFFGLLILLTLITLFVFICIIMGSLVGLFLHIIGFVGGRTSHSLLQRWHIIVYLALACTFLHFHVLFFLFPLSYACIVLAHWYFSPVSLFFFLFLNILGLWDIFFHLSLFITLPYSLSCIVAVAQGILVYSGCLLTCSPLFSLYPSFGYHFLIFRLLLMHWG
jgi:hypothetical protein